MARTGNRLAVVSGNRAAGSWVQTERAGHEQWATLAAEHPRASSVLHVLVARMEPGTNALVASHAVLATACVCSIATVKRALALLAERNWIEVVQVGASGSVNAYVVNARVAWSGARNGRRQASFSATVFVGGAEQPKSYVPNEAAPLHKLPSMWPGERQLPAGDGLPPPSAPSLPGLEPDLPATMR